MNSFSSRAQLRWIALGYGAAFVVAAALLYSRYLLELNHAADVSAASGMWAAGDLLLGIFLGCLFMIPTFFLVWLMARFEAVYTIYSQVLLGLGLSAAVCLGLFVLGKNHISDDLKGVCLCRLAGSPFVLVGMGVSRFLARSDRARKLTSYALLVEGLTLAIAVGLFLRR